MRRPRAIRAAPGRTRAGLEGSRAARFRPRPVDTLRADHVGAYGSSRAITPNIDALASRGATFASARTAIPLTLPSHAVMLTGRLPYELGIRDNGFVLGADHESVAEVLKGRGFQCAAFVSSAILGKRFGLDRGFDVYDDLTSDRGAILVVPERRADETVARALDWVGKLDPSRRFFLFLHFYDPHSPHDAPAPYRSQCDDAYDAEIAAADAAIGTLTAKLRALGLEDRTGIALVADHGEALGEHGEKTHGLFLYDATLRVPFILVAPSVGSGITLYDPVSLCDLRPTMLGLLGIDDALPPGTQPRSGVALWPQSHPDLASRPVYGETLHAYINFRWSGSQSLVMGERKVIVSARPEVYDLAADRREVSDISADLPELVASTRTELATRGGALESLPPRSDDVTSTLQSLGYVSGGGPTAATSLERRLALPDPKDRVRIFDRYEEAVQELGSRRYERGIEILEEVQRDDPDAILPLSMLGAAQLEAGDSESSARTLRLALEIDPGRMDIAAELARALQRAGKLDEAIEMADRALAKDPTLATAHLVKADALRRQGKTEEVEASLRKAAEVDPGNVAAELALADIDLARGNDAGARSRAEAILARHPGESKAFYLRGVIAARSGQMADARRDFQAAVSRDEGSSEALVALATMEARAGELDIAISHYEKARALGNESPQLLNAFALTLVRAGHVDRARPLLELSLATKADQPQVRAMLQALSSGSPPAP
ncbi:MAG: sulfatase-like hydrolase/transferase [Acidobacteriota bacterium]